MDWKNGFHVFDPWFPSLVYRYLSFEPTISTDLSNSLSPSHRVFARYFIVAVRAQTLQYRFLWNGAFDVARPEGYRLGSTPARGRSLRSSVSRNTEPDIRRDPKRRVVLWTTRRKSPIESCLLQIHECTIPRLSGPAPTNATDINAAAQIATSPGSWLHRCTKRWVRGSARGRRSQARSSPTRFPAADT